MKAGIPLIFFHKGDSFYLQYTFNQIIQSNPNSDIYLIGDEKNKHYEKFGIQHVDMTTCEKTAKEFEKIYVHLSSMNGFVERICFQRWMYMRDFVLQAGITGRFCCLDSDVLVYGDITEYHDKYCGDADVTLHGEYGPGCNVFKNVDVLTKLVDNTFRYYTDAECLQHLKDVRANEKNANGGSRNITDMYMIEMFVKDCGVTRYDLLQIRDNISFDSHIAKKSDTRFAMKGIYKDVSFEDKKAYCTDTKTGQPVMMMLLHIQGFHKNIAYRYYAGDPKKVMSVWKARYRFLYQILKRKMSALLKR
ncbi:MAG: hypothetical protein IJE10_09255 [Clostridia bacterium]|nr:hypothetical protein [Clostridia bacterium]